MKKFAVVLFLFSLMLWGCESPQSVANDQQNEEVEDSEGLFEIEDDGDINFMGIEIFDPQDYKKKKAKQLKEKKATVKEKAVTTKNKITEKAVATKNKIKDTVSSNKKSKK